MFIYLSGLRQKVNKKWEDKKMKELKLTQSYSTIDEMLKSEEVEAFVSELEKGEIAEYAIVSRIGNRYDLDGKKIAQYAFNPYFSAADETSVTVEENKKQGENTMKYAEIETLINNEIAKAVAEVTEKYEKQFTELKEQHAQELANTKYEIRAELLAKLNG